MAIIAFGGGTAQAQQKELSDKSVSVLMQYAWTMTPQKFTSPDGKTVEVNKSKPNDVIVPVDVAREVIRVARMTAYAQLCELAEEQRANFQTLMRREEARKRWSDQQLLYINQLHLFTVMTLTGKVQLVERNGDKEVVVHEGKPVKTETCTDTEKQKVQQQIAAYIKSEAPAAATPAKRAEPTPTTQKK